MLRGNRMEIEKGEYYLIATDCPIEFVILGPKGRREGILIKSDDMKPDVLGFAISERGARSTYRPELHGPVYLMSAMLGGRVERSLHVVTSMVFPHSSEDERSGLLRLAWRGRATASGAEFVEQVLELNAMELERAVGEGDRERIELCLAPILLKIMEANGQYEARRAFSRAYFLTIGLVALCWVVTVAAWTIIERVRN
jgi:hypothetical protein